MLKVTGKFLLCSFLLSFCLCKTIWINTSKDNDLSGANSVAQLQIMPADVSGWQQSGGASGWTILSASNLHTILDGGDMPYLQNHLIEAGIQYLQGPSGKSLQVYCMDFGTETNSRQMVEDQKIQITTLLIIPNYPDSVAIASATLGGVNAYAYFNKFYIELQLTGFQDQGEALRTASLFMDLYSSKIE
ncbi:MAG: hypothetical protein WBM07_09925 [Chitinivibrionales bacterium]